MLLDSSGGAKERRETDGAERQDKTDTGNERDKKKQPIRGETDKWLHPPGETKFLEQIRLLISRPENSFIMQQGRQTWPPSPRIRQILCFVFNITVMEFSETLL